MSKYSPPIGYRLPGQPYSRFGYDGQLWLPARLGRGPAVIPSVLSAPPAPPPFTFFTVFPTGYQIWQTSQGTFYGPTKAGVGNTATATIGVSGVIAGKAVPIKWKATNSANIGAGASFNIYYDGIGTTPAMTGVIPTAGTPVPLTGAALGLSATWSAGTSVVNNTWDACSSGQRDLTPNMFDYIQPVSTKCPIITIGVNGEAGLLYDGIDDVLDSSCPLGTDWFSFIVARRPTAAAANTRMIGPDSAALVLSGATSITMFAGAFGPIGTGLPTNTFGAIDCRFSSTVANTIQCGSGPLVSGASPGNPTSAARSVAGSAAYSNIEVLAGGYVPVADYTTAAFRAACTTLYAGGVAI